MRRSLFTFALLAAVSASSLAHASFYGNARVGISKYDDFKTEAVTVGGVPGTITNKDTDDYSTFYAAAVGYRWSLPMIFAFRTELEYTYHMPYEQSYVVNGAISVSDKYTLQSLMLNAGIDFNIIPLVTPYALAGIGGTHVSIDRKAFGGVVNDPDSYNKLTWTAGVGIAASLFGILQGDIGYRYTQFGNGGDATRSQEITLGARLSF